MSRNEPERHIVACGGGGVWTEAEARPMRQYLVELSGKDSPRVCLIPTATGDREQLIVDFHAFADEHRVQASHLPLFDRLSGPADLREHLLAQDLIWVNGGNTANMLAIWRVHGIGGILREAWEAGIILAGSSAGALCWFHGGSTDSFGPLQPLVDGLKFLDGSLCPHYDGEPRRRPTYLQYVAEGVLPPGLALDNGAAAHFVGTQLAEVVAWLPGAGARRVTRDGDAAIESPLPARQLAGA